VGFVRPKRRRIAQLRYAQSWWICKYIEEKYGHDAILRMLDEFRAGAPQEDVFPNVLGKSLSEFTSEFFGWTKAQVATWGYDEETTKKYDELRERGEDLIRSRAVRPGRAGMGADRQDPSRGRAAAPAAAGCISRSR
jgi:hypothetical protein